MSTPIESFIDEAQKGNPEAIRNITEGMLPMVKNICKSRAFPPSDFEDIVQNETIVILKAIRQYNKEVGVKFSTYARKSIENKLSDITKNYSTQSLHIAKLDIEEMIDVKIPSLSYGTCITVSFEENLVHELYLETFMEQVKLYAKKLTPLEQQILWTYYKNEISLKDFAKTAGISTECCYKIKERLFSKLRKNLNKMQL